MEEVYMIPQKELDQLVQYYKGELTENALLNKAAHLAAQNHVLLADPKLPASIVNAQTKPISQELTQLIRRLRQFPGGAGAAGGAPGDGGELDEEDEGGLVTGPVEQWLKRMIKGTPTTPKAHKTTPIKKKGQPSTSGSKIPVPKKSKVGTPLTTQEEDDLSQRLEKLRERRKTLEEQLAASGIKGEGKGKGKGKGKGPLALQRLKPLSGWEDWAQGKKSRRRLEYDSA